MRRQPTSAIGIARRWNGRRTDTDTRDAPRPHPDRRPQPPRRSPPGVIARVRDAVAGGVPDILAPGEAADIALPAAPDMALVRAALDGAAIDAIATPAAAAASAC